MNKKTCQKQRRSAPPFSRYLIINLGHARPLTLLPTLTSLSVCNYVSVPQAQARGVSDSVIGLVFSCYALTHLVMTPVASRLVSRTVALSSAGFGPVMKLIVWHFWVMFTCFITFPFNKYAGGTFHFSSYFTFHFMTLWRLLLYGYSDLVCSLADTKVWNVAGVVFWFTTEWFVYRRFWVSYC